MKNKQHEILLSFSHYEALKQALKDNKFLLGQLKDLTPSDDAGKFLDELAIAYERDTNPDIPLDEKQLSDLTIKRLTEDKQLFKILRLSRDRYKNDTLTTQVKLSIRNILYKYGQKWLYTEMTTKEILELSRIPFEQIPEEIDKLIKKYNRKTFKK